MKTTEPLTPERASHLLTLALNQRNLPAPFSLLATVRDGDENWLIALLNTHQLGKMEAYLSHGTLHQIRTQLGGTPVWVSNTSKLAYAVRLSAPLSQFPELAALPPALQTGCALLGINRHGATIAPRWSELGHTLVIGQTRFGKSSLLRSLAFQAQHNGAHLLLADRHRVTFPMFAQAEHAARPEEYLALAELARTEMARRSEMYARGDRQVFYETLDEYNAHNPAAPLAPWLVIFDEFSASVKLENRLAAAVDSIAAEGLKFGVQLVIGAQDFEKRTLGTLRDQMRSVIAFRVSSYATARNVGVPVAVGITQPGRAATNHWGMLQTFYLSKPDLLARLREPATAGAACPSDEEQRLLAYARSHADRLTLSDLIDSLGYPPYAARKLHEDWLARGWLAKRPEAANACCLTENAPKTAV